jgi:hypothetical protein
VLRLLLVAATLAWPLALHAGYLDAIDASRLPKEFVPQFDKLKRIEPYADVYRFGPWRLDIPKERLTEQLEEIYATASAISLKNPGKEILLCLGLVGYFGYNLDMPGYDDRAVENFTRALNEASDDYRPLWFLGMHYAKATRAADGMKLLLKSEVLFHPSNPDFWVDYAIAADLAQMPQHALFAVSKVKELTGKAGTLDEVIGARLRSVLKTPARSGKIDPDDLWELLPKAEATTIVSYPFGCKVTVPDGGKVGLSGYDGKAGGMKIPLIHRTGKTGREFVPNVFINVIVADEGETFSAFTQRLMKSFDSLEKADFGLNLNELSSIAKSDRAEVYRKEGGGLLALVTFERETPPGMSGFILEEPQNFPGGEGSKDGPVFYRYRGRVERFRERLFYMIMLEAPASVFAESLEEFRGLLKTLVVE